MKKRRQRKNCPQCIYQVPSNGACSKNPEWDTYTKHTIPEDPKDRDWCTEMKKRKIR